MPPTKIGGGPSGTTIEAAVSMGKWALKPGRLKPLSREGLLLLAARCAMRVEPWRPPGQDDLWQENLDFVVAAAGQNPTDLEEARRRMRRLSDAGALSSHQAGDEPLGRCHNYAACTLAEAVKATSLEARPALVKTTIDTAKLSVSIFAVWAHAGRVEVPEGDPVEVACTTAWSAIAGDVEILAPLTDKSFSVGALRDRAPLWPTHYPWGAPS